MRLQRHQDNSRDAQTKNHNPHSNDPRKPRSTPTAPLLLTSAEQENIIARARVELFNLAFELSGHEHARLEAEVNA